MMRKKKFSIMGWNIWLYTQLPNAGKTKQLLNEFKRLAETYQPDFISLSEVLDIPQNISLITKTLQGHNYTYIYSTKPTFYDGRYLARTFLCSRLKIDETENIIISKNYRTKKQGHSSNIKEIISARLNTIENHQLKIIAAHPLDLITAPKDHREGIHKMNQLMHSSDYLKNTVLIGDMNEWRFLPRSFRAKVSDIMHCRTGSWLHPTWQYKAHRFTPFRANLDYLYWSKQGNLILKEFKVLSSNVSDHKPIFATFILK